MIIFIPVWLAGSIHLSCRASYIAKVGTAGRPAATILPHRIHNFSNDPLTINQSAWRAPESNNKRWAFLYVIVFSISKTCNALALDSGRFLLIIFINRIISCAATLYFTPLFLWKFERNWQKQSWLNYTWSKQTWPHQAKFDKTKLNCNLARQKEKSCATPVRTRTWYLIREHILKLPTFWILLEQQFNIYKFFFHSSKCLACYLQLNYLKYYEKQRFVQV